MRAKNNTSPCNISEKLELIFGMKISRAGPEKSTWLPVFITEKSKKS